MIEAEFCHAQMDLSRKKREVLDILKLIPQPHLPIDQLESRRLLLPDEYHRIREQTRG